jgi:indole-3-glycerol phosphate synthase
VGTYLDSIVAWHRNRAEVGGLGHSVALEALREAASRRAKVLPFRGFAQSLTVPGLSVIAEIKRRSPSKGALAAGLDPATTALSYVEGGAACLSVLTDTEHFGGSVADLQSARNAVGVPVIRKDFTVCEADVLEAAVMGADCVLFIVAALSKQELKRFAEVALEVGIDVLWETHDEAEVEIALENGAQLIGVNQRDLHTFQVDQDRAVRVVQSIPSTVVRVAESGVRGPEDAQVLRDAGYDAVLVGESVVTSGDRAQAVRALINASTK